MKEKAPYRVFNQSLRMRGKECIEELQRAAVRLTLEQVSRFAPEERIEGVGTVWATVGSPPHAEVTIHLVPDVIGILVVKEAVRLVNWNRTGCLRGARLGHR